MRWRALLTHLNGAIEKKWKAGLANRNGAPSLFSTRTYCTGHHSSASGLYGLSKHLNGMDGFRQFFQYSLERAEKLVRHICEAESEKFSPTEVIGAFDGIFSIVNTLLEVTELCMTTNDQRDSAEGTFDEMSNFLSEVYRSPALSEAVKRLESEKHLLSQEDQMFVRKLKINFQIQGSFLCSDKREKLDHLRKEIDNLSAKYKSNIAKKYGSVDLYHCPHKLEGIGHLIQEVYKGFRIPTDEATLSKVLRESPDTEIRKAVYIKGYSTPKQNVEVMMNLVDARREMAQLLGYKSYIDGPFKDTIGSEKAVMTFLTDLSRMSKQKSQEELVVLKEFCSDFKPWDEEFYMEKIMGIRFPELDSSVQLYFNIFNCIEGLHVIVKSLFGATIQRMKPAPGECFHEDIIKLLVNHPEEGDWGFIYLDLFERKGKDPVGGCTYQLKMRRRITQTKYQLPVVVIVSDFPCSLYDGLVHEEVIELFHEFGHAIHTLLSRTDRHLVCGTNVAWDLLEVPSKLFEYYANDYRVLRMFAHDESGKEIPQELVKSMQEALNLFSARKLQHEILKALLDVSLFGESCGDIRSLVGELTRKYTNLEHVDGTNMKLLRFDHLIGYGGAYYSYLYGECFAATIWRKLCQEDPLSPAVGSALRAKFLQFGGGKDPTMLLRDLVGEEAYTNCDGGIIPKISNFCVLKL